MISKNGNRLFCIACRQTCNMSSTRARSWLGSICIPCTESDVGRCVLVPPWNDTYLGKTLLHSSHRLLSINGVVFCSTCGFYGAVKSKYLGRPCRGSPTTTSKKVIDALMVGDLPPKMRRWPNVAANPDLGMMNVNAFIQQSVRDFRTSQVSHVVVDAQSASSSLVPPVIGVSVSDDTLDNANPVRNESTSLVRTFVANDFDDSQGFSDHSLSDCEPTNVYGRNQGQDALSGEPERGSESFHPETDSSRNHF